MGIHEKVVFVTGAAGGLGAATCRKLASGGWRVLAADLAGDALDRIGDVDGVATIPLDITDPAAVEGLADAVREHTAALAGVVNFAGILEVGPMIEMPEERLRRVLEVNVMGTFRVNQALFPLVEAGRGRIVNISSETGWQSGGPFNGAYAMSKHAIEAYSDSLRRELALLNMHVSKIQPGPFKTEMTAAIGPNFDRAAEASTLFGPYLRGMRGAAVGEGEHASDPKILAEAVLKALTAKRPGPAYSVKAAQGRSLLEKLPTPVTDVLLKEVIRRGSKP